MIHGWFNNHSIVFRFPFFMFSSVLRMPCYWNLGSLVWCLQEETPVTAAQGPPRPPVGHLVCTRRSALWSSQGRGAQAAFVRVRAWVCSERYLTRHFRQILTSLYDDAKAALVTKPKRARDALSKMGYSGPFCCLQLDMTSVSMDEFCTASVSVIMWVHRILPVFLAWTSSKGVYVGVFVFLHTPEYVTLILWIIFSFHEQGTNSFLILILVDARHLWYHLNVRVVVTSARQHANRLTQCLMPASLAS